MLAFGCASASAAPASDPSQAPAAGSKKSGSEKISSGGFSFLIEPAPSWVIPASDPGTATSSASGMHYALVDHQVRLEREGKSEFRHIVRVVDEIGGLGAAAQIQADFDPGYQTLVFHQMTVIRGGHRIDRLDPKKIQLLHRETQLDYLMYDGHVTASIVLDDIRIGDRIEYAYSIRGMNPVFNGKFVMTDWPSVSNAPTTAYRLRLLAPEGRDIHYRLASDVTVTSSTSGGVRETLFSQNDVPQLVTDNTAPETIYLASQIQLSEFDDWASVADWGTTLFSMPGALTENLRLKADAIRASATSPEDQLRAALEFVQSEVRYFGMEMGEGSHHPTAPGKVLDQRFGDCKDKVALLLALLSALHIEARPVLVSTHYRSGIQSMLPSPLAFDHVVARVSLANQVYLLDATRAHQTGPLKERESVGLGAGLELRPGTHALLELPGTDSEERIAVEDVIRIADFSQEPMLETRVTYSGELAEFMRQAVARQPGEQLENGLLAIYGRFYPKIHIQDHIAFAEVPMHNAFTLVAHFGIPHLWQFPEEKSLFADTGLWNIANTLQIPNDPKRLRPFRLGSPGIYRHHITVEYPEDVNPSSDSRAFDDEGAHFDFHVVYSTSPRTSEAVATLHFSDDAVPGDEWPSFAERVVKLRPRFAVRLGFAPINQARFALLQKQEQERVEAIKTRKWIQPVPTPVEAIAAARELALKAWLDGNRLSPDLRAQVYRDLGVEQDNLGWTDQAAASFDEALRLAPEDAKNYEAAARNAFLLGKDDLTIERAQRALAIAPSDPGPRAVLGYADYYLKRYQDTKDDMQALARTRSGHEQAYPALWLYLAARRNGENGSDAARPYLKSESNDWPYPILRYFLGSLDFPAAEALAQRDNKGVSQLCELYFYAGEKFLIEGDTVRARTYLQKSVDTRAFEFNEYAMARRSLASLYQP